MTIMFEMHLSDILAAVVIQSIDLFVVAQNADESYAAQSLLMWQDICSMIQGYVSKFTISQNVRYFYLAGLSQCYQEYYRYHL
jgi:hypothetical protein